MEEIISVIIPAHNAAKTIADCIESLLNNDFPKDRFEIIAVNNCSRDDTSKIIRRYPVRYVFAPRRGRSIARNAGINASCGEIVAFIDADCIADKFWLRNMSTSIQGGYLSGSGGRVIPVSYSRETLVDRLRINEFEYFKKDKLLERDMFFQPIPHISAANAIFRKDALYDAGLFDERLNDSEDIDLTRKLFYRGYMLKYVPEAIVYARFFPPATLHYLKRYLEKGISSQILNRKWPAFLKKRHLSPLKYCFNLGLMTLLCYGRAFAQNKKPERFLYALRHSALFIGSMAGLCFIYFFKKIHHGLIAKVYSNYYISYKSRKLIIEDNVRFYFINGKIMLIKLDTLDIFIFADIEKAILTAVLKGTSDIGNIINILDEEYEGKKDNIMGRLNILLGLLENQGIFRK